MLTIRKSHSRKEPTGRKGPKGDLTHFLLKSALGTSLKHTHSYSMCFILPTVDGECNHNNIMRPYGSVGLGHTHFVMSQSRLIGSLNKWTTLALGGLEARKHEQRVDLMSVNRW